MITTDIGRERETHAEAGRVTTRSVQGVPLVMDHSKQHICTLMWDSTVN